MEGKRREIKGKVLGNNMMKEMDNEMIMNYERKGEMKVGKRIMVNGRVIDEGKRKVKGELMELWKENEGGRYRKKKEKYIEEIDKNLGGVGRKIKDEKGY